jgi:glycosyltransferase involved in cell wall biosynthesis
MRVMHVFSGRETGGIASVALPLIRELKGRGLDVRTACLADGAMTRMARALALDPIVVARKHTVDIMLVKRLAAIMRREGVDIVHTHSVSGNFYGRLAAYMAGGPVVLTSVHADTRRELADATGSEVKASVWHFTDLFMSRLSRVLLANSRATANVMREKGVSCEKIRVVCNGIECSGPPARRSAALARRLGIPRGAPVVGSVGRLTGTKNYGLFLRAARRIHERRGDVFFLLVGDGPERASLEAEAKRLGIAERVVFTGWQEDTARFMALMDIFVLSSVKEGFGLVILEAMKNEKPVVCTAVGGVPELVEDGRNGFLVPSGDEDSLAGKVMALLENRALRRRLGKEGRKRLEEEFTLSRMADAVMEIYEEAS